MKRKRFKSRIDAMFYLMESGDQADKELLFKVLENPKDTEKLLSWLLRGTAKTPKKKIRRGIGSY